MNTAIELHDSDLVAITHNGTSVDLSFSPAYIHRSEGIPGVDPGTGWTQAATFTFSDASVFSLADLPGEVADGWLFVGNIRHDNLVPASGVFEAPCELRLECFRQPVPMLIRGTCLTIVLQGEPTYVEEVP